MKRLIIGVSVLIFVFCNSCESKIETENDRETEFISKSLGKLSVPASIEWLVILPGLGCNGCIQEGEAFMKDYFDTKNVYFILTKIQSLKILEQKIGKKVKNRTNVLIDNSGQFDVPTKNQIYPCIVHLKNAKIIEHQFQCPVNAQAFQWLKMQIN